MFATPRAKAPPWLYAFLGKRLYELNSDTNAMLEIAEEVADRDHPHYGHRIDVIDKRWDGIGDWIARKRNYCAAPTYLPVPSRFSQPSSKILR